MKRVLAASLFSILLIFFAVAWALPGVCAQQEGAAAPAPAPASVQVQGQGQVQSPGGAESGASPALPPVAAPLPAAASEKKAAASEGPSAAIPDIKLSWSGYFEALAILFFALAALWAVLWLLRRRGGFGFSGSAAPGMRIESRLALGPKKWILVVRYLDRRLVIGMTDQSIRLLTEFSLDDDRAQGSGPAPVSGKAKADKTDKAGDDSGLSFASLLEKDKNPTGESPSA